jgi:beta-lactamase regulating signal transducer with metallopeptidase domain
MGGRGTWVVQSPVAVHTFLGIVALLALLLRKNQARIRYWLWMTASAKFLIPFSLLVSLGSHLPWPIHAVAPKTTAYVAIEEMSQPFLEVTAQTPIAIPVSQPTASHVPTPILPPMLTALWLSGFITMMCFWCVQWRRISRLVRSSGPLIEGREVDLLRKAERLARLPRSVPLLASGNSMEPGVFGIIRPVLLWPQGIALHMDDAHLGSVLAHEVCHVQRRDNLTSAIHMLVEAIFCDAKPDVEVATIKPHQPGNEQMGFSTHGGTLLIKNLTLGFMMGFAYDPPVRQIAGKPGWVDTDKWDIEAKADTPGELNPAQTKLMMQKLFAERFGLQAHEEKRKMAAFVLSVSKDGPKMTELTDASLSPGQTLYPSGVIIGKSLTMAALAETLQNYVFSKPVPSRVCLS